MSADTVTIQQSWPPSSDDSRENGWKVEGQLWLDRDSSWNMVQKERNTPDIVQYFCNLVFFKIESLAPDLN